MSHNFTIGDVCHITTGKLDSNAFVENGKYRFYTCAKDPIRIDHYEFDDDVVLVAGNNANGNFHVNRFKGKFNAYQRTYIITPKGEFPIDYIYYILKLTLKLLKDKSQGSQTKFLTIGILKDIIVPASINSEKLAKVLSDLDAKIELNNKINAELEAMAKLIYDYWFVQFDFPDANGKPYKSSGGKMVYNEALKREIPEGWAVKELSQVEPNIVTGKTPSTKISEYFDGSIPFICIGDVRGNMHITNTELTLTELGAKSQANKYIPEGAICVTCIASPGLVAFATKTSQTNQQLNSVVCKKHENRYYLYYYLNNYFRFAKAKTGNTFANMNKGDFSSIMVIEPKNEILIEFSKILKPSIEKVLINSKENRKLAELRDWLLPMLMNGQVSVGDAEGKIQTASC